MHRQPVRTLLLVCQLLAITASYLFAQSQGDSAGQSVLPTRRAQLASTGHVEDAVRAAALARLRQFAESKRLDRSLVDQLSQPGLAPIDAFVIVEAEDIRRKTLEQLDASRLAVMPRALLEEKSRSFGERKSEVLADIRPGDYQILQDYSHLPIFFARFQNGSALACLLENSKVKYIAESRVLRLLLKQSLPMIHAPEAHHLGATGRGVSVAVVDTGVDYARAEFGSCSTPGGVCKVIVAEDVAPNDGSRDDDGHGTNVAAIVLGVAPDARIVSFDVFRKIEGKEEQGAVEQDALNAIQKAIDLRDEYKIVALNLSLGSGRYDSPCEDSRYTESFRDAIDAGIAVIVASGNDGYTDAVASPACVPEAFSVGAVYDGAAGGIMCVVRALQGAFSSSESCPDFYAREDKIACFSNSASFLDILAPGGSIVAGGEAMCGTSQAAPHVAGAYAVVKSAKPTLSVEQVEQILVQSGTPVEDSRGATRHTFPRVDVLAAVQTALFDCHTTQIYPGQPLDGVLQSDDCPFPQRRAQGKGDGFFFTAQAGDRIALSVRSADFDTCLYLFGPDGRSIAWDDDGGNGTNSRLPAETGLLPLTQSGKYVFYVTSYAPGEAGRYQVSLVTGTAGLISNGSCDSARAITNSYSYHTRLDTSLDFDVSADPVLECGGSSTPNSVWFKYVSWTSGLLTINTYQSDYDTVLSVYAGECGALRPVVCNDDSSGLQSRVSFFAGDGGISYYIMVSSYSPGGGRLEFDLSFEPETMTELEKSSFTTGSLGYFDGSSVRGSGFFADRHFFHAEAGEYVVLQYISSDYDTYLRLSDIEGRLIGSNDDGIKGTTHSRLPAQEGAFHISQAGWYVVEVTSFNSGQTGGYVVILTPPTQAPGSLQADFLPNPVPKSSPDTDGYTWFYGAYLSETGGGSGVTITSYYWDFYDSAGNFLSRQTTDASMFASWYRDCESLGAGRPYVPAGAEVCGNFRTKLGTESGSMILTFEGVDDGGREVTKTSPRLHLSK